MFTHIIILIHTYANIMKTINIIIAISIPDRINIFFLNELYIQQCILFAMFLDECQVYCRRLCVHKMLVHLFISCSKSSEAFWSCSLCCLVGFLKWISISSIFFNVTGILTLKDCIVSSFSINIAIIIIPSAYYSSVSKHTYICIYMYINCCEDS